ncbi:MAG: ATP-binding protein, partial [Planctomycetaceae bacterium]|nr:ATP-binding protein [Planctomycetaceae bacterium]
MTIFFLAIGWALFAFVLSFLLYGKTYYWIYPEEREDSSLLITPILIKHFGEITADKIVIISREFPKRVHVELYNELKKIFSEKSDLISNGLDTEFYEPIRMNDCLVQHQHKRIRAVPFVFKEIDIGDEQPVRCAINGIWLWKSDHIPMSLLFSCDSPREPKGFTVDIAVPQNSDAINEAEQILKQLEQAVKNCSSYRYKVLSLEQQNNNYSGASAEIVVHQLRKISREQLILPEKTVELLERNIFGFVKRRQELKTLGLPTKKGLLFYGPPGTGKTHTLHYLIGKLCDEYTTILITAEQVGQLDEYFAIARLLEPAIMIIEDVDIIGRNRKNLSVCTEVLLNKLLNAMDGLREDVDILFLLTTNHPETLEEALKNRPGRIDQAIEFSLPDESGREKLIRLYSCGLEVSPELTAKIVTLTEGVSAAFIRELLRRSAQFLLERDPHSRCLELSDAENAIDELLH